MRKKTAFILAAVAVSVGGNFALAVDRTWVNTTNGFYDTASNWSPNGVPTSADNIIFNQPGVIFNNINFDSITGNRTVNSVTSVAGSPIIRSNGTGTFRLTSVNTSNFGGSGIMIFQSNVGRMEFESPTINVNTGRTLQFSSANLFSNNISVGQSGSGQLTLNNSSVGTLQILSVGVASGSNAIAEVSTDAQLTVSNTLNIGNFNDTTSEMRVTFGGDVTAGAVSVGSAAGSSGKLIAEGAGSTVTANTLFAGNISSTGSLIDIRNNATFTVSNTLLLNANARLELRGAQATIASLSHSGSIMIENSTFSVGSFFSPGFSPIGTFDFRSGTFRFASTVVDASEFAGTGMLFDGPQILTEGKRIEAGNVGGTFNVSQPFILDGGTLMAGSINNPQNLELRRGRLEIAGANVNFTAGPGALGTYRDLQPGVSVVGLDTSVVNIFGGSTVIVRDGARLEGAQVTNAGTLVLDGPGARVLARTWLTSNTFLNNGLIRGGGIIDAPVNNNGIIELRDDNALTFTNSLTNNPAGRIQGRGSVNATSLINNGRVELSAGFSDINATVTNNSGGRIIVSGGGVASFYRNVTNAASGEIRTSAGGRSVFFGPVNGSGIFTGTGVVQFEDSYSPGSSPGLIAFGGDVELSDASTLNIELGGPARGSQYDALDIVGSVDLRGDLVLSMLGGYVPDYGVPHTFINATSRSGIFATVAGVQLSPTKFLAVTYNASGDVIVTAALPGDANVDGTVNFADLLALARNFGSIGRSWADGDFGGNGSVQFDDLLALARNFGSTLVLGEIVIDANASFDSDWALAQSVVPEPTALAGLAALSLLAARRRR